MYCQFHELHGAYINQHNKTFKIGAIEFSIPHYNIVRMFCQFMNCPGPITNLVSKKFSKKQSCVKEGIKTQKVRGIDHVIDMFKYEQRIVNVFCDRVIREQICSLENFVAVNNV